MSKLWLRETFPAVAFSNTFITEKPFRLCLDESKIKDLPSNSTDIYKNMDDNYVTNLLFITLTDIDFFRPNTS